MPKIGEPLKIKRVSGLFRFLHQTGRVAMSRLLKQKITRKIRSV